MADASHTTRIDVVTAMHAQQEQIGQTMGVPLPEKVVRQTTIETCPVMVPDYAVMAVYYRTQPVPCARAFLPGFEEDYVEFRNASDPAARQYTPIGMCAIARRLWHERQARRIARWKREQESRKG